MPHDVSLITTIAAGLGLAMVLGVAASRAKIPPIVGYLVAGILVGPHTPGFVADMALASQLAEIGVMLLMFGVGLHLSMGDLLSVRRIAVPGAIVQIAAATLLGAMVATLWGWTPGESLVFGLCLSCASTVVLLRALEDRGVLETVNGRIAVGWLVVEDLAMVLVLVVLPAVAGLLGGKPVAGDAAEAGLLATLGITLAKVAAFVALMLVVGRRVFPRLLWLVAKTGSRELFTLCVVATALGVAYGSAKLFDVSFALGAFFAGMMMRESEFSHRAADESLPLREAFSVLFFVSVGMLFDPQVLLEQPVKLLAVVAIIMVGKTLAAIALVLVFRYPLNTALTVGASLAQIGEFSFILASLGASAGAPASGGAHAHPRGLAHLDRAELRDVRPRGAGARLDPRALELRPPAGRARRPAGAAPDVGAPVAAHRPGGAGGLRARGQAHRRGHAREGRGLRRRRAEPREGRADAREGHPRRLRRRGRARHAHPGARRARGRCSSSPRPTPSTCARSWRPRAPSTRPSR